MRLHPRQGRLSARALLRRGPAHHREALHGTGQHARQPQQADGAGSVRDHAGLVLDAVPLRWRQVQVRKRHCAALGHSGGLGGASMQCAAPLCASCTSRGMGARLLDPQVKTVLLSNPKVVMDTN